MDVKVDLILNEVLLKIRSVNNTVTRIKSEKIAIYLNKFEINTRLTIVEFMF